MSESVTFEKVEPDKVLVKTTIVNGDVTTIKQDTRLITAQIAFYDAQRQANLEKIASIEDTNIEYSSYITQLAAL